MSFLGDENANNRTAQWRPTTFPVSEVLGPAATEDEIQALIDRHKLIFVQPCSGAASARSIRSQDRAPGKEVTLCRRASVRRCGGQANGA
jgi:hypothetical protein